MVGKILVQSVFGVLLFILLLFAPAGTIAWPEGWAYLLLFFGCSTALTFWMLKVDPALLAARMQSPLKSEQKPRDRAIVSLLLIFFGAWYVFIALDAQRFEWSDVPIWLQVIGAVLMVWSFWGFLTVLRVNSFAATTIGVQKERNQRVIASGPYAVIRHPMYAYLFPFAIGTTLMLGSLWGLVGLVPMAVILAARTLGEEEVLAEELPGYRDYVRRVRYRLLPGIW
ncbi:isoprenylcysteine carboxylmethyltransferase family protein [Rhodopseudomonas sp. G2_2311]|jgi:protein-S-isoprenylcysteine O-methyltransferase Ste14|uniref:methyltransferase family protein n=1 Tax=Rhodopseudomonas sp. G2_2311 TaxID=3114287 RepID=UPI0039C61982